MFCLKQNWFLEDTIYLSVRQDTCIYNGNLYNYVKQSRTNFFNVFIECLKCRKFSISEFDTYIGQQSDVLQQ